MNALHDLHELIASHEDWLHAIINLSGRLLDGALSSEQREALEKLRMGADLLHSIILTIPDEELIFTDAVTACADFANGRNTPKKISGTHVLIVDDDPRNRQVLAQLLGAWGCRTSEAHDAGSGLEALRAAAGEGHPVQVALIEMQLPGGDGEGLGRAIAEDAALSDTGLVALTAAGKRGDAARLEGIGFAAYLTKPLRQRQLRDTLGLVLERAADGPGAACRIITRHTLAEAGRRHVRILLAEDTAVDQKISLKILEKLGYCTDAVASGREAIEALSRSPYDLVLMDVQMPEMDGLEAARQIRDPRTGLRNPKVPIIGMTGSLREDRERCIVAGMDDYLAKPVQPGQLAQVLTRWIDATDAIVLEENGPRGEAELEVLDRKALMERIAGDEELLREITELFIQDTRSHLAAIQIGIEDGDGGKIQKCAQGLKAMAGSICAMRLHKTASQLERAARNGELTKTGQIVKSLKEEFDQVKRVLGK